MIFSLCAHYAAQLPSSVVDRHACNARGACAPPGARPQRLVQRRATPAQGAHAAASSVRSAHPVGRRCVDVAPACERWRACLGGRETRGAVVVSRRAVDGVFFCVLVHLDFLGGVVY